MGRIVQVAAGPLDVPLIVIKPCHYFPDHPMWMESFYLAMNSLMLDTERVVIQKDDVQTRKFFNKLGLTCIEVEFMNCFSLGGGFHCYTSDIRRRGDMTSYFDYKVLEEHDARVREKLEKQKATWQAYN